MVTSLLNDNGFNVSAFCDYEIALQEIRNHRPQLIVLDVFLGDNDGLDICKKLKANTGTRHIPILVCSGFKKVAATAVDEYGAAGFISKPFLGKDLIEKINHIIPQTGNYA